jgi:Phytanoyl-CoA dioxygenase (PhyH)
MRIRPEDVEQFRKHGYLGVPEFFSAREVAAMQAEVERFKRVGMLRNVATDGDGKTHSRVIANLQLCPMYHKSPLFRALPFDPKVVEAVRRLLGDPVLLHLDQIFLKPGGHGTGTNWHQNKPYRWQLNGLPAPRLPAQRPGEPRSRPRSRPARPRSGPRTGGRCVA